MSVFESAEDIPALIFIGCDGDIVAHRHLWAIAGMIGKRFADTGRLGDKQGQFEATRTVFQVLERQDLLGANLARKLEPRARAAVAYLGSLASAVATDRMSEDKFRAMMTGEDPSDWERVTDDLRAQVEAEEALTAGPSAADVLPAQIREMLQTALGPDMQLDSVRLVDLNREGFSPDDLPKASPGSGVVAVRRGRKRPKKADESGDVSDG